MALEALPAGNVNGAVGNIASGLYDLPGTVQSQNASQSVFATIADQWNALLQAQIGSQSLPTDIYVPETPPVFRTETEQLDLIRVVMILVGVFIGVKILR